MSVRITHMNVSRTVQTQLGVTIVHVIQEIWPLMVHLVQVSCQKLSSFYTQRGVVSPLFSFHSTD